MWNVRLVAVIGAVILGTACSPTLYKEEAAAVGTAASGLSAALGDYERARAEAQALVDETEMLDSLAIGEPLRADNQCTARASAAYRQYTNSLVTAADSRSPDLSDAAFALFGDTPPCDLHSDSPGEQSDNASGRVDGDLVTSATETAGPEADASEDGTQAATLAGIRQGLDAYGVGLVAITSGESLAEVNAALEGARQGLSAMLLVAGADARIEPATQLVTAIWGLGIEAAQHQAVVDAVEQFDRAWRLITPDLIRAARYEHARVIMAQARAAEQLSRSGRLLLNQANTNGSLGERYELYQQINARVREANARLAASREVDPAVAINALTDAHVELISVVRDESRGLHGLWQAIALVRRRVADLESAIEKEEGQNG